VTPKRDHRAVRLPVVAIEPAVPAATAPRVAMSALDTVWIQLTGTLCNIACRHCFITCGPEETRVPMMTRDEVRRALADARALGARDYYFTGGEPMMHPDFWALCEETLRQGPLTVLTNGLLVDDMAAARAKKIFDAARYSFDLRVSLDGMTADENDPIRGKGTFEQITASLRKLASAGFSPTVTVVEHSSGIGSTARRGEFFAFCRALGLSHPRLKFLPLLRIGREPRRTRVYRDDELDCLRAPIEPSVETRLVCATSRLVAAGGVYTCPILLDAPTARLGDSLSAARRDIHLRWSACRTCVADGLSCNT
jgi:sulfatase maturation enzyme AslB (radical SAM superfamily)